MGRIIECCVRNVDDATRGRLRGGDDAVRVRPCLEHCGVCRDRPFLVVDGELVTGRRVREQTASRKSEGANRKSEGSEDAE